MGNESFHEVMSLVDLPPPPSPPSAATPPAARYASLYPAWVPGEEIDGYTTLQQAYGGHVYTQASLAALRALEAAGKSTSSAQPKPGIMGFHASAFTASVLSDRPIVYEVTPISTRRTFCSSLVTARQTAAPAPSRQPRRFTKEDADTQLGDVCFSCICTFKAPEPIQINSQDPSPQVRYASILDSRPPHAWPHAPQIDLDAVQAFYPGTGPGDFPILDMKKVDMSSFNEDKPLQDKRELILYRLRAPLPANEPNHHVLAHVYESDRNGLLMVVNHVGLGMSLAAAASLTYSYFVHVNPEMAVMEYGTENDNVWWVQEVIMPRVANGRGALMVKTWSPAGVHVATGYQDGIMRGINESKEKL